ncbi:MAG: potassium channel family protein [Thermoplasmata archaeon]
MALFLTPVLSPDSIGRGVVSVLLSFVLLASLNVVAERKGHFRIGLVLFLASVAAMWAGILLGVPPLLGAGRILSILFLAVTVAAILPPLLRAKRVTAEVLWGALSVYLLLGVTGAFAFAAITAWQPEALVGVSLSTETALSGDLVYFSFVTQTTLGYGDIRPVTPLARSVAMFLAVSGVLYLAVLVASFVGIYVSQTRRPEA